MPYTVEEFLQEIEILIKELEQELTNRKSGIIGEGTVEQLELFIEELKKIQNMVMTNSLPPKGQRYTAFTWYITDSWSNNSQLGNKLCALADKYKRKLI